MSNNGNFMATTIQDSCIYLMWFSALSQNVVPEFECYNTKGRSTPRVVAEIGLIFQIYNQTKIDIRGRKKSDKDVIWWVLNTLFKMKYHVPIDPSFAKFC